MPRNRRGLMELAVAAGMFLLAASCVEERVTDPRRGIEEVAAGKRKTACASWWGYDPVDATAALQSAIHSGARKVIVENMGQPWIVDKIQLADDQEVFFERGAVKVTGMGTGERVKATLCDPTGKKVEEKDSIAQAHQFVVTRKNAPKGEVWSIRLDKPSEGVLEDNYMQLQGIPPVLAPSKEAVLKPVQ